MPNEIIAPSVGEGETRRLQQAMQNAEKFENETGNIDMAQFHRELKNSMNGLNGDEPEAYIKTNAKLEELDVAGSRLKELSAASEKANKHLNEVYSNIEKWLVVYNDLLRSKAGMEANMALLQGHTPSTTPVVQYELTEVRPKKTTQRRRKKAPAQPKAVKLPANKENNTDESTG